MNAVTLDGEGASWEAIGVAADDSVCVFLVYMTRRVLRANQDVVCLSACQCVL